MSEKRSIHKICMHMHSFWDFFAGSTACKYIIFSRKYPQRLNPLTQVHATKQICMYMNGGGKKMSFLKIKYNDLVISVFYSSVLGRTEVIHSFFSLN